ncbi:hypothetical protein QR504_25680, partial [Escherichia coli]|uniref:hypothetical protein n=1 Tax=Escherichia coli TaxID=562 RepID=UPI002739616C
MEGIDNEEKYKPVPFQPTNPHDPLACFCNIILHSNANGDLVMRTETKTSGEDIVQEKLEG